MPVRPTVSRFLTHRSLAGGIVLGAIAWALLAVQIALVLSAGGPAISVLVATAIPAMLSLTLFIGALGVYHNELDDLALRISAWTLLGIVLFSAVLGVETLYLQSRLGSGVSPTVLLLNVAAGGAVLGFLIGLYDAHQRRLRRDLQDEYDRTVALSQRLSVLARILRHDLRNDLNVIIGQADRLQTEVQSGAASEAATAIRKAGDDLLETSENIRQFGTLLANPRPDHPRRRANVGDVVEAAIDVVRTRHDTEDVTFDVTGTGDVTRVEASPFLRQALTELVENAVVHTDSPDPRIEVDIDRPSDAGDVVEIRIADDGPGIPEAERDVHESEIETQLDHSTGLGLWFVRWIVDASDGDLAFETGDSRGTTVRIRLPHVPAEEAPGDRR